MSVKRTCAISSVRLDMGSGMRPGFKGESGIGGACYVSMLAQAIM